MRLSKKAIQAIQESTAALDPGAEVYLFGSRVHDDQRGGDIDLLILSTQLTRHDRWTIQRRLCDLLGEQKIDIVLAHDRMSPFVRLALEAGVKL